MSVHVVYLAGGKVELAEALGTQYQKSYESLQKGKLTSFLYACRDLVSKGTPMYMVRGEGPCGVPWDRFNTPGMYGVMLNQSLQVLGEVTLSALANTNEDQYGWSIVLPDDADQVQQLLVAGIPLYE